MFEKRLAEIRARKLEIRKLLEADGQVDLDKLEEELRALENEEQEIERRREMAQKIQAGEVTNVRTVATTKTENPEQRQAVDPHDTPEYRKAFMDYVTRGVKSDILEFRADQTTGTGDIGAVIPTTILNRIVERAKDYGRIWSRVTKTGIQGGVQIPVSAAKPTATWVAEDAVAETQKKEVKGTITFSYHKLQVRVAVDLVAGTVALPVFEATLADNVAEAMIRALEAAIISGTGTGQPLGITKDTGIPAAQIVEVTAAEFAEYKTWARLMGKVPRSYRNGVTLIMNDADWNTHIIGMVDSNKQPVARVTYGLDGTIQERFLGRDVIPVEDLLPSIDTAQAGDVVAILVRLQDYMVNSNMQLTYRRYFDENTDKWISKATMICDGKLADPNGVVLIKLKAAS
ncbi:phage major capsid protein [Symbiobacterium terraclitae]|uniref:phage major capsid protein n=1 Tax=Symbiobacterium terraclitae TaxID=557451 RepID=UPI0035B4FBE1